MDDNIDPSSMSRRGGWQDMQRQVDVAIGSETVVLV
jgi:hypothetical protein